MPLSGVTIRLKDGSGNVLQTMTTGLNGSYSFTGLRPGTYQVVEPNQPASYADGKDTPGTNFGGTGTAGASPSGAFPSSADAITNIVIPADSNTTGANYNFGELPPASIGDKVFLDSNGNGIQDVGEPGVDGVTVQLYDSTGTNLLATTTTAGGGLYNFGLLPPGTYQVKFGDTANGTTYTFTARNQGSDPSKDSNADPATGLSGPVTVGVGQTDNTIDAGLYVPASAGDLVWYDVNGNGIQDGTEPGIGGATVTLTYAGPDGVFGTGDDVTLPAQTTGAAGNYSFTGLAPGNYRATVSNLPNGLSAETYDLDGASSAPYQTNFTLASGQNRTDVNFGFRGTGAIGHTVYNDQNGDGVQQPGEPGLPNVPVTLTWYGPDGLPGGGDDLTYSTTTDASGHYQFNNLPSGNFSVLVGHRPVQPDADHADQSAAGDARRRAGGQQRELRLPGHGRCGQHRLVRRGWQWYTEQRRAGHCRRHRHAHLRRPRRHLRHGRRRDLRHND